jgi:uncharacterized membrane protein YdcZ (DUF606 family)
VGTPLLLLLMLLLCSAFMIGLVLDLFACHEVPLYMVRLIAVAAVA